MSTPVRVRCVRDVKPRLAYFEAGKTRSTVRSTVRYGPVESRANKLHPGVSMKKFRKKGTGEVSRGDISKADGDGVSKAIDKKVNFLPPKSLFIHLTRRHTMVSFCDMHLSCQNRGRKLLHSCPSTRFRRATTPISSSRRKRKRKRDRLWRELARRFSFIQQDPRVVV